MKNRSRKVIIAITAILTFGTLFAVKGSMYRHHWQHRSEQCKGDWHKHHGEKADFKKADNEIPEGSNN